MIDQNSTANEHTEGSSGLCIFTTEVVGMTLHAWIIPELEYMFSCMYCNYSYFKPSNLEMINPFTIS